MNTQIFNLETKINELVMRMNNAQTSLTSLKENDNNEMFNLRNELNVLVKEFERLKIEMLSNKSDEHKISIEVIEDLIRLIEDYISARGKHYFRNETFTSSEIDDFSLRVNYSQEIEIEQATINVGDYFTRNFNFKFEDFINYVDKAGLDEYKQLIKYLPEELFNIISEIVEASVQDVDNSPTFSSVDDFECELMYSKKIDITDITIDSNELSSVFNNEFDFPEDDIDVAIKQYHNFIETYSSEDSDDNSDEN
jgi:hypothetical protein